MAACISYQPAAWNSSAYALAPRSQLHEYKDDAERVVYISTPGLRAAGVITSERVAKYMNRDLGRPVPGKRTWLGRGANRFSVFGDKHGSTHVWRMRFGDLKKAATTYGFDLLPSDAVQYDPRRWVAATARGLKTAGVRNPYRVSRDIRTRFGAAVIGKRAWITVEDERFEIVGGYTSKFKAIWMWKRTDMPLAARHFRFVFRAGTEALAQATDGGTAAAASEFPLTRPSAISEVEWLKTVLQYIRDANSSGNTVHGIDLSRYPQDYPDLAIYFLLGDLARHKDQFSLRRVQISTGSKRSPVMEALAALNIPGFDQVQGPRAEDFRAVLQILRQAQDAGQLADYANIRGMLALAYDPRLPSNQERRTRSHPDEASRVGVHPLALFNALGKPERVAEALAMPLPEIEAISWNWHPINVAADKLHDALAILKKAYREGNLATYAGVHGMRLLAAQTGVSTRSIFSPFGARERVALLLDIPLDEVPGFWSWRTILRPDALADDVEQDLRQLVKYAFRSGEALEFGWNAVPAGEQTENRFFAQRAERVYAFLKAAATRLPLVYQAGFFQARVVLLGSDADDPVLYGTPEVTLMSTSGPFGEFPSHYFKLALVELVLEAMEPEEAIAFLAELLRKEQESLFQAGAGGPEGGPIDQALLDKGFSIARAQGQKSMGQRISEVKTSAALLADEATALKGKLDAEEIASYRVALRGHVALLEGEKPDEDETLRRRLAALHGSMVLVRFRASSAKSVIQRVFDEMLPEVYPVSLAEDRESDAHTQRARRLVSAGERINFLWSVLRLVRGQDLDGLRRYLEEINWEWETAMDVDAKIDELLEALDVAVALHKVSRRVGLGWGPTERRHQLKSHDPEAIPEDSELLMDILMKADPSRRTHRWEGAEEVLRKLVSLKARKPSTPIELASTHPSSLAISEAIELAVANLHQEGPESLVLTTQDGVWTLSGAVTAHGRQEFASWAAAMPGTPPHLTAGAGQAVGFGELGFPIPTTSVDRDTPVVITRPSERWEGTAAVLEQLSLLKRENPRMKLRLASHGQPTLSLDGAIALAELIDSKAGPKSVFLSRGTEGWVLSGEVHAGAGVEDDEDAEHYDTEDREVPFEPADFLMMQRERHGLFATTRRGIDADDYEKEYSEEVEDVLDRVLSDDEALYDAAEGGVDWAFGEVMDRAFVGDEDALSFLRESAEAGNPEARRFLEEKDISEEHAPPVVQLEKANLSRDFIARLSAWGWEESHIEGLQWLLFAMYGKDLDEQWSSREAIGRLFWTRPQWIEVDLLSRLSMTRAELMARIKEPIDLLYLFSTYLEERPLASMTMPEDVRPLATKVSSNIMQDWSGPLSERTYWVIEALRMVKATDLLTPAWDEQWRKVSKSVKSPPRAILWVYQMVRNAPDFDDGLSRLLRALSTTKKELGVLRAEAVYERALPFLRHTAATVEDGVERIGEISELMQLSAGVEEEFLQSLALLGGFLREHPQAWKELVVPTVRSQEADADYALATIHRLYDAGLIQEPAHRERLRAILTHKAMKGRGTFAYWAYRIIGRIEEVDDALAQLSPAILTMEETLGPNAKGVYDQAFPVMKYTAHSFEDWVQRIQEITEFMQISAGVERQFLGSLASLDKFMQTQSEAWDRLVVPTVRSQRVGSFLVLQTIRAMTIRDLIKGPADHSFLRDIVTHKGVQAWDILHSFLLTGAQHGIIVAPLSAERILITEFLETDLLPLAEIYREFRDIKGRGLPPAEEHEALAALKTGVADLKAAVTSGEVSEADRANPIFAAMLQHVFPPATTIRREQYLALFDRYADHPEHVPDALARLQNSALIMTTGGYLLKEGEEIDTRAWAALARAVREGNRAEAPKVDMPKLGMALVQAYAEEKLSDRMPEFLNSLYAHFRASRGATLPEDLLSYQNLMLQKEFVGDTLLELIADALSEARAADAESYAQLVRTIQKAQAPRYTGVAKNVERVLSAYRKNKMTEEKALGVLGHVLKPYHVDANAIWKDALVAKDRRELEDILGRHAQPPPPMEIELTRQLANGLLGRDYARMHKEMQKWEFAEGAAETTLTAVISKRRAHSVSALHCGVCTAPNDDIWDDPSVLYLILFNEAGIAQGGMHLKIVTEKGRRYLTLPGINPSNVLMGSVEVGEILDELIRLAQDIAEALDLEEEIWIPRSGAVHSNRPEMSQEIVARRYDTMATSDLSQPLSFQYDYDGVYVVPPRPRSITDENAAAQQTIDAAL